MDGTITEFNLDYMGARRLALQELEKLNLRAPDMTEEVSIYVILKTLKGRVDPETFDTVRSKFYALLEDMELKAAEEVMLYPGAIDTLSRLRERSLKIGLVTNNGRVGTEMTVRRYKLWDFFDAVVTRDDCEEVKPAAAPVLKVLAELRSRPEEAILVGDGVMDVMAARAAGLRSVAVPTGPFKSDRLLQAEPDYLLGSINELPRLIDFLTRTSPT